MNNTTKGQYELAKKMLKGHIDIDEVVLMSGLSKEIVEQLNEEINPKNSEIQILKDLDTVDLNIVKSSLTIFQQRMKLKDSQSKI